MNAHLLIPGLLPWPSPIQGSYKQFPALNTLLNRAQLTRAAAESVEAWLCKTFAVERQTDWPVAALSLLGEGKNPEDYYWLRADPVHLQVNRDQLFLADSEAFKITAEEAEQLLDTLNTQFPHVGNFYAISSRRWYLKPNREPQLQTSTMNEVVTYNIHDFMPQGSDAKRWHSIMNEIQMCFHSHPVNENREQKKQDAINSVWFWGGGKSPSKVLSNYHSISGSDVLLKGISVASTAAYVAPPPSATSWLMLAGQGNHFMWLDVLQSAERYGYWPLWQDRLMQLEINWFAPLLEKLKQGKISQLEISVPGGKETVSLQIKNNDLWKVWRYRKL